MLFTWFKGCLEHEEMFKKDTVLNLVFEIMIKHLLSQSLYGLAWYIYQTIGIVKISWHQSLRQDTKNINYIKWKQTKQK